MTNARPHQYLPYTTLRDIFSVLYKNKRTILAFFFAVMVLATLTLLLSETYVSESKIMIQLGRESVTLDPTATTGQVVQMNPDKESEVNSEVEILSSRELAEKVVDALGVDMVLEGPKGGTAPRGPLTKVIRYKIKQLVKIPFSAVRNFIKSLLPDPEEQIKRREAAVQLLMKHITFGSSTVETVAKKSNMVTVSYEADSAKMAHDTLEKLIQFYLDAHVMAHRTSGSYSFFREQTENLRAALAQTEEDLNQLRNKTGVASVLDQRLILLQTAGALRRDLADTESASAASSARIEALEASLAIMPGTLLKEETTGFANSSADEMKKRVDTLKLKEQELLSTFTENSILVQEKRREIREAEALLHKNGEQRQVTHAINETREKLEFDLHSEKANLSSLVAKTDALKAQIAKVQNELSALNDSEVRLAQLERNLEMQKLSYRKYSDSLEQSRIDEALEIQKISNISVVQPASFPVEPFDQKKPLKLAMALFLGVLGGVGIAFLNERLDHSFKKPEDVDSRLQLPVLATLPDVSGGRQKEVPGLGGAQIAERADVCQMLSGRNGNGDALRELLSLCRKGGAATAGAIGLASCRVGEGVSTSAGLLARQIVQQGGRVLIVDANSRSPSQHLSFGTKLYPGLAEFGSNGRPAIASIQPTSVENLDILSAGDGSHELAASALKAFADALPALKREYSHIICDLPPLQEHSSAMRIAGMMDGVVLVVEAEKTRWEVAGKAKEELLQAHSKLLGVILNKRRFHIPGWLYRRL
jgi:capsular exopolysaccharide synthesis family protein